jgi:hypothetical protein
MKKENITHTHTNTHNTHTHNRILFGHKKEIFCNKMAEIGRYYAK